MTDPLRVAAQRLFDAALDSGFPLEEIDHESSYAQRVTLGGRDLDDLRAALAADTARPETGPCWFCKQTFAVDALIAGYDTFDEQRLACLACNERMDGDWKPDTAAGPTRAHDWTTDDQHDYEWCRVCLLVRQRNRSTDAKPCKGPARTAAEPARPGLDVEALGQAYIRVRGAHNPTAEELDGDEEVWPCAWCRLAVEQHIAAARLTEDRP